MERETPRPVEAMPSDGLLASTSHSLALELRELRSRLRRARAHAAAALSAGLPGRQPGEALQRFLAADEEVAAIVRRIKKIQAFTSGWKDRARRSSGQM